MGCAIHLYCVRSWSISWAVSSPLCLLAGVVPKEQQQHPILHYLEIYDNGLRAVLWPNGQPASSPYCMINRLLYSHVQIRWKWEEKGRLTVCWCWLSVTILQLFRYHTSNNNNKPSRNNSWLFTSINAWWLLLFVAGQINKINICITIHFHLWLFWLNKLWNWKQTAPRRKERAWIGVEVDDMCKCMMCIICDSSASWLVGSIVCVCNYSFAAMNNTGLTPMQVGTM